MDDIAAAPCGTSVPLDGPRLLASTAEIGEYFSLPRVEDDTWRPLAQLFDDATLKDYVERTRLAIATSSHCEPDDISTKLAASSFQLGIAARLLSPVVGAAACFGAVPILDNRSLVWRPTSRHHAQFAVTEVNWVRAANPERAAALISESVMNGVLGLLNSRLKALVSLSPQVAWGNVISSANGAVTVLAISRPEHEDAGRALVRALLRIEPLVETGDFEGGTFVRRSCCLFYQAPRSGLCGDCVLTMSGGSQRIGR
ncbi:(2Fe-2S)-binding protein [Mycolicibacterium komossense]|uniref:(2Fe-2S)-binding protein n=1 Tax=Mycolicibacterium komossense TaxID=1779 RepID=A0ABT3CDC0_9MYCO|nr:(2Fe-2S)-binding protein [Mycolicibacterium komossense]MCV7227373.1 (2Fe-2S)-binding protein [Mycolicibacterium komossense]